MKQIFFIEMIGEPGSYDASVYDHIDGKDSEGHWFIKRFGQIAGISINTRNVCIGETLPEPEDIDGLVLSGSYNSVHDHTQWQRNVRTWLPPIRKHKIPILAICGSHQLLSHANGANVEWLEDGAHAGTFPIRLTEAGKSCPIMQGVSDVANFQFANAEHVVTVPDGTTLVASSDTVPVAALDFGNHCYSTQFHPEGTPETLGAVWRYKDPDKMENYRSEENGKQLVENFLNLVTNL